MLYDEREPLSSSEIRDLFSKMLEAITRITEMTGLMNENINSLHKRVSALEALEMERKMGKTIAEVSSEIADMLTKELRDDKTK